MVSVEVVQLDHGKHLPLPSYETEGSAGMDLRCAEPEAVVLEPMQRRALKTGLRIALPLGFEAQIRPRSGLALKKGITVANAPGTIDADYRGEILVALVNIGQESVVLEPGERIAQMVVAPVTQVRWQSVSNLDETSRGRGGFGHTGTT